MSEQWPAPTPRDEMLARVIVRGRRIRMINRLWIALGIGGAVAAGALGVGLGYSGAVFGGSRGAASLASGALTYYSCPATDAGGQFHHGDRVLVTGLDESGEWLQVRNPDNLDDRVWVLREYVDPDDELDLPVAGCTAEPGSFDQAAAPTTTSTPDTTLPEEPEDGEEGEEGQDDDEAEEPTTTTAPPTTVPTTAPPTTAPTTAPPTTQPTPTTTAPTTTSTTAPTTTTTQPAPVIGTIQRSPSVLREADATPPANQCSNNPSDATTATISTVISNATSATMSWSVGSSSGSVPMSRNGQSFSAVLGPFGETTIPASPGSASISVTITATGPGGQRSAGTSLTLNHCEPFG